MGFAMTHSELSDMIDLAERLDSVGEITVLATLFSANGSTYRRLGSMMVAGPGTMIAGGVSGGCLEEYIARHGRGLIEQTPAAMLSFDADPDADGSKPSLGCGGSIEVLVERCTPGHLAFLREIRTAHRADFASTAACLVRQEGEKLIGVERIWIDDQPSTKPDLQLARLRQKVLLCKQSRTGMLSLSRRALVHFIPPMTRLVIFGAGNDVRPLCSLAKSLCWHVTLADRRARLATRSRFADADEIIAADWLSAVNQINFTPRTAAVLMTHSLEDDIEIVPHLMDKPTAFVGALGPRHRRSWVLDGAGKTTTLPEAFVQGFRGPIGLDLGDRTPAGIAVSIVSEILATLNDRPASPLSSMSEHSPEIRDLPLAASHIG
jgi:xanthine/CO dehydrogenase XdhC/CoxF family maturation factor